jgi:hypothetical protein
MRLGKKVAEGWAGDPETDRRGRPDDRGRPDEEAPPEREAGPRARQHDESPVG